jgi:hypothetical protein
MLIKKAVMASKYGDRMVMADVGSAETHQKDDQKPTQHRIPARVLPSNMPTDIKRQLTAKHIPDMLLYSARTRTKPARYTIVEIKYCRDTDPAPQTQAAIVQHAPLVQAIHQYDPSAEARIVPLVLGVAGYVYKTTIYDMQQHLGLPRTQAKTLARKLHLHAVKSLTKIIHYRRQRELKSPQHRKRRKPEEGATYNWKKRKRRKT